MASDSAVVPAPPQTQALSSKTFRPPPLDGSLTLAELYDWHGINTPNHPLFEYTDSEDNGELICKTIYWPQVARAMHQVAKLVREGMKISSHQGIEGAPPVVAIVAALDTITYYTTIIGVMRAGFIVFPISPRNSPMAVAHLLAQTSVSHILVGREQAFKDLVRLSLDLFDIKNSGLAKPSTSEAPIFEEIYNFEEKNPIEMPFKKPQVNDTGIILHSSGSTAAFPKPIRLSHLSITQMSLIPWFGERDLTGQRISLHSVPMYHGLGVIQIMFATSCGPIMTTFKPKSPAMIPTPDSVFKYAMATKSDIIYCVPSFVETWSEHSEYVDKLSKIQGILFGGGPLSKDVGDFLSSKGVTIFNLYGCTEGGIMSPIVPREVGADWEYFKISRHIKPVFIPDGSGNAELVMLTTKIHQPAVINTKVDGVDAYATSDLLAPHPTKPGYWKVFGRADDQIIHSTGEKTNPGPLEKILCQDPHIANVVMFGRGRFQAGVLVSPRPQFVFDPANEEELAKFRNKIWPTVETMNAFAPQHSRIFKEMILFERPNKPFTYTAKNTVKRQAVIDDYEPEIDTLYKAVSETTQEDIPSPSDWNVESTEGFVRTVIRKVMKKDISDYDDILQHGCDSLQITWIRNTILRAIRDSAKIDTRKVSSNFVYQNPTVRTLSTFVLSFVMDAEVSTVYQNGVDEMKAMVAKYTTGFSPRVRSVPASQTQVILLTGSTGALGCSILSHLAEESAVSRIYAFNRRASNGISLKDRQIAALRDRGYDPGLLETKVVLIEGDLSQSDFGISPEIYNELHTSVTHIIHNAWPVNFNIPLRSFESSVKGLRHLIDFALSSPLCSPTLVYTSSIGVFQHINSQFKIPIEGPIGPEVAVGQGYSESKWVSENILEVVRERCGLHTVVVRVGQISGGLNGSWNVVEWLPSMIRSSLHINCFPTMDGSISFIPLNTAGKAVADFRQSKSEFVHLVHPRPVKWAVIAQSFSTSISVPLVPYADWLGLLEKSAEEKISASDIELLHENPALRILDFFRSVSTTAQVDRDAMNIPKVSVAAAVENSAALDEDHLDMIGEKDVLQWLKYWKQIGFLPN